MARQCLRMLCWLVLVFVVIKTQPTTATATDSGIFPLTIAPSPPPNSRYGTLSVKVLSEYNDGNSTDEQCGKQTLLILYRSLLMKLFGDYFPLF